MATAAERRSPEAMIQVGTEAPDFELASNQLTPEGKPGKKIKLSDFRGGEGRFHGPWP